MTTSVVSRLGRAPEEGIKAPVKAVTITNITLQGNGFAVGSTGYVVQTGDRILVNAQTMAAQNGIYIVGPNAWERASDMNADNDVTNGQLVVDAATSNLYQLVVVSPWSPGATPINFIIYASSMPPMLVLTLSDPIDLVDTSVALVTGAADPDTEQHLEYDFQAIQSKADATTAAPLFLNPLGSYVQMNQSISGDPGFEETGITINGTLYQASDKVSDIGSANLAQLILHKHSSLYPPFFVAARSQGDTAAHVIVNDTDILYGFIACGWDGTDYAVAAECRVTVQGTPGSDDMPGQWEWYTTPDGATNPLLRMTLGPSGDLTLLTGNFLAANFMQMTGDFPTFDMVEQDAALDQKRWRTIASGEGLFFQIISDAVTDVSNWMVVNRSGTGANIAIDSIDWYTGEDVLAMSLSSAQVMNFVNTPTVGGVAVYVTANFDADVAATPAVAANTAKVSNVPTALSIGTVSASTFGITSDGSADDVVLPVFNATDAGLAPGSGGGTANFLRADGSWAAPPGAGGGLTVVTETTTSRTATAFEAIMVDDDTAGGLVTIDLPAGSADDQILVKKLGTTANVVIDGDAAETIDGAATFTLTTQYASVWLIWNGTEWSII